MQLFVNSAKHILCLVYIDDHDELSFIYLVIKVCFF